MIELVDCRFGGDYSQLDYLLLGRAFDQRAGNPVPTTVRKGLPWRAARYPTPSTFHSALSRSGSSSERRIVLPRLGEGVGEPLEPAVLEATLWKEQPVPVLRPLLLLLLNHPDHGRPSLSTAAVIGAEED